MNKLFCRNENYAKMFFDFNYVKVWSGELSTLPKIY